jgi:hypothetical protein
MHSRAYLSAVGLYRMTIDTLKYNIIISEMKNSTLTASVYEVWFYAKNEEVLHDAIIKTSKHDRLGNAILESHLFLLQNEKLSL